MKTRSIKILPLLSLLASLGVIALWIVSYRVEEGIAWTDWKKVVILSADRGDFLVSGYSNVNPADLWTPAGLIAGAEPISRIRYAALVARQSQTVIYAKLVFWDRVQATPITLKDWNQNPAGPASTAVPYVPTVDFSASLWPFVLILLLLPARWLILWAKARKLSRVGLCRKCGYDLRATPGRCPECGTEVKRSNAATSAH